MTQEVEQSQPPTLNRRPRYFNPSQSIAMLTHTNPGDTLDSYGGTSDALQRTRTSLQFQNPSWELLSSRASTASSGSLHTAGNQRETSIADSAAGMSQPSGASPTPMQATAAILQPKPAIAAPWELLLRRSPAVNKQPHETALQGQNEGPERSSEHRSQDEMLSPLPTAAQPLSGKFSIFSPSQHRPVSASLPPMSAPAGAARNANANADTAQPATSAQHQPQEWLCDLNELLPDGEAGHKQGSPSFSTPRAAQQSSSRGTTAGALPHLSAGTNSPAAEIAAPSKILTANFKEVSSQPSGINRSTLHSSSACSSSSTVAESEQPKASASRTHGEGEDRGIGFAEMCSELEEEAIVLKARCTELEAEAAKNGAAAQLRAREVDELAAQCKDLRAQLKLRDSDVQVACSQAEALEERCSDLERKEAAQVSAMDALAHENTASKARCEDLEMRLAEGDTRLDKALQELHRAEMRCQELQAQASVAEMKAEKLAAREAALQDAQQRLQQQQEVLEEERSTAEERHRDLQEAAAAVEAKHQLWEAQRPRILREIRRLRAERQKLRAVAGLCRP